MNKAELIALVAEKTGFTKKDAEKAVNATMSSIEETLVKGERVQLIGFGTFEVRQRKARTGRNPRKPGETIQIAASKAPAFKAGKALKDAVNKVLTDAAATVVNKVWAFTYKNDTYLVKDADGGSSALTASDNLVKLAGQNIEDLNPFLDSGTFTI